MSIRKRYVILLYCTFEQIDYKLQYITFSNLLNALRTFLHYFLILQHFKPKQDEDNLGDDRLRKGYQVAITSYEHESIVWNAKVI